jgi:hypothetical protein
MFYKTFIQPKKEICKEDEILKYCAIAKMLSKEKIHPKSYEMHPVATKTNLLPSKNVYFKMKNLALLLVKK